MASARERGRSFGLGVIRGITWVVKVLLIAAAIYIFFPPFWDAAFVGTSQALHDAPYRAADRARHLWRVVSQALQDASEQRRTVPAPAENRTKTHQRGFQEFSRTVADSRHGLVPPTGAISASGQRTAAFRG